MKLHLIASLLFGLAFAAGLSAQGRSAAPASGSSPALGGGGQHGGLGVFGGNGIAGTVTSVAAGHYRIKTEAGRIFTIYFSSNTRILKQSIQRLGEGAPGGGNLPLPLKSSEIRVGDAVGVMGEVDASVMSVGATVIVQIDPERAKEMRAMEASFGMTWLVGKVTAIHAAKIVLLSSVDNASHAFIADEKTVFRKRRESITLADVRVGDMVRVEGVVKAGVFVAATVAVMSAPPGGTPSVPRGDPPDSEAQPR